jgi:hypothetical protein
MEAWVQSQISACGICAEVSGTGDMFSPVSVIAPMLDTHSSPINNTI